MHNKQTIVITWWKSRELDCGRGEMNRVSSEGGFLSSVLHTSDPAVWCDENLFTYSIQMYVSIILRNKMPPISCGHIWLLEPVPDSWGTTGLKVNRMKRAAQHPCLRSRMWPTHSTLCVTLDLGSQPGKLTGLTTGGGNEIWTQRHPTNQLLLLLLFVLFDLLNAPGEKLTFVIIDN